VLRVSLLFPTKAIAEDQHQQMICIRAKRWVSTSAVAPKDIENKADAIDANLDVIFKSLVTVQGKHLT
jgi:hypothetical protein